MISSEVKGSRGGRRPRLCHADGRTVAELSGEALTEDSLMAAMAHGPHEAVLAEGARVSDTGALAAPAARARPSAAPREIAARWGAPVALLLLIAFNLAVTPHFVSWQTLHVNLTQVRAHRYRRGGHDAGDRDGRDRPLGRLADGDRGRRSRR
jgi:hypothetical protein